MSEALKHVEIAVKDNKISHENGTESESNVASNKDANENSTTIVHCDPLASSIFFSKNFGNSVFN